MPRCAMSLTGARPGPAPDEPKGHLEDTINLLRSRPSPEPCVRSDVLAQEVARTGAITLVEWVSSPKTPGPPPELLPTKNHFCPRFTDKLTTPELPSVRDKRLLLTRSRTRPPVVPGTSETQPEQSHFQSATERNCISRPCRPRRPNVAATSMELDT